MPESFVRVLDGGGADDVPFNEGGAGVSEGDPASFARSFKLRRSRSLSIGAGG
jgi:hypothetical protein